MEIEIGRSTLKTIYMLETLERLYRNTTISLMTSDLLQYIQHDLMHNFSRTIASLFHHGPRSNLTRERIDSQKGT